MNDKKYIVGGFFLVIFCAVAGTFYYFYPGAFALMVSDTSGTNGVALDVDSSSSSDSLLPPSLDTEPSEEPVIVAKIPDMVSVKKKASEKENNGAPAAVEINDDVSSGVEENNSSTAANILPSSCAFPDSTSAARSQKIILNEIAWMGSTFSSNAEWIEIKNISGSDIDLGGWELMNQSGKIRILFPSGDTIASGGLALLSRNDSTTGISYSGTLANVGDVLAIVDAQCNVSDILDASSGWPAGNNVTKQTLERDADGIGWHTSVLPGGTPGAENSTIAPPIPKIATSSGNSFSSTQISAPAATISGNEENSTTSIIGATTSTDGTIANVTSSDQTSTSTINSSSSNFFTHILIAAVQIGGASSTNDLVKLYNPTSGSIDISGWKLHKRSQTGTEYSLKELPTGSIVPSGQSFLWANSAGGFSETVGANVSSTETLAADNSIALLDASGTVVDAVAWGLGTNQFGEGMPYPTDPSGGQLLVRQSVSGTFVDSRNNASDFILQ